MRLSHLALTHVRSFEHLDMDFEPGVHVVYGENGSGKTNLLEAIALLSTARRARAGRDGELISWTALAEDPLPAAQLSARIDGAAGSTTLDITVMTRAVRDAGTASTEPPAASRRFRVNGVARRASDLIGRLRTVLFSVDDVGLVDGAPAARRRFLDVTISQLEPLYVRALQRYGRVLVQRNSLLKRLQERRGDAGELDFWDQEAATAGAVLVRARAELLSRLDELASDSHRDLSTKGEQLRIAYEPALPDDLREGLCEPGLDSRLAAMFRATRPLDIRRAMTLHGPHRDDIAMLLDGHAAGSFASRGEQRTLALALRLGEVALSRERTGDAPVLLLDDVLSELDVRRRARVVAAAYEVDQVFITTPDEDRPRIEELPGARRYALEGGTLTPR
ncbi:MAG: DNA replication/repair protein RecF [Dehalococcoidia bacterium]|nr:DNA replication/repair protein RecF [Dehalococcoidia bacterium]